MARLDRLGPNFSSFADRWAASRKGARWTIFDRVTGAIVKRLS
jgi:hypothetical protein